MINLIANGGELLVQAHKLFHIVQQINDQEYTIAIRRDLQTAE